MTGLDLIANLRAAREACAPATPIDEAREAADLARDIAGDALEVADLAPAVHALAGAVLILCDEIERGAPA